MPFLFPSVGSREDQELDFKVVLDQSSGKPDHLELAKDIAAFANAYGGTIIVGASEKPKGVLFELRGLSHQDAAFACDQYAMAQAQRIRPSTIVTTSVEEEGGRFFAVIRIEPSMGQAIGVRFKPREETDPSETKQPPEIYGFPLRVGDNTAWLQPEQLPMLMIPQLRRTIVLLRAAIGQQISGQRLSNHSSLPQGIGPARVLAVDEPSNLLVLEGNPGVPLDQIRSVWHAQDGWHLHWVID